jgi:arylsulfatase A-like enzyme
MVRKSALVLPLAAAHLLALPLSPVGAQDEPSHPNVIVILTDDQGWGDIGYHNERVYSPRIDALARSGLRFRQHYSMPQCTPTRVALMTGRYPGRFGNAALAATNAPVFPLGTPTLGSMFQDAGVDTFLCGKWHMGSSLDHGPQQFGFDRSYGSLGGAVGMYDHRYRAGKFETSWHRDGTFIEGHENGTHATDLVADAAVRFIEEERDRPFFLYLAFHAVHTPLDERGRFVDRPTQLDPEDPTRWLDEDEIEWFHDPEGKIQSESDPEKRLLLAAIHHLDHAVGRVVDALERTEQRDGTLILYSSDNGPQVSWPGKAYPDDLKLTDFNQPIPFRGHKTDVYEGGIRVPGFASWPGHIAPGETDTPVHVVDWMPTLSRLLGPDVPRDCDGVDLGPLLMRTGDIGDRDLYWIWSPATNRWALRHGDWKIVRYGRGEPEKAEDWQLFDLANDPAETTDVSADHGDRRAALHARFLAQRAKDRRER